MKFFQGAVDAHARGVFIAAQGKAHGAEIALLEKPEQDRRAVFGAELGDGFIEQRRNLSQAGRGIVRLRIHLSCLVFTGFTAVLGAQGFAGDVEGVLVQPATEHNLAGKGAAFLSEANKNNLSDVLGQVRIAAHQTQRSGIDEIDVARDEFAKGGFRTVPHIFRQQLLGLRHVRFGSKAPHEGKTEQKNNE